jgi:hypothetical protein
VWVWPQGSGGLVGFPSQINKYHNYNDLPASRIHWPSPKTNSGWLEPLPSLDSEQTKKNTHDTNSVATNTKTLQFQPAENVIQSHINSFPTANRRMLVCLVLLYTFVFTIANSFTDLF